MVRLPYITRNNVRKSKNVREQGNLVESVRTTPLSPPGTPAYHCPQEVGGSKELPWARCRTPKQPRWLSLVCEPSLGAGDLATNSCMRLYEALPFLTPLVETC